MKKLLLATTLIFTAKLAFAEECKLTRKYGSVEEKVLSAAINSMTIEPNKVVSFDKKAKTFTEVSQETMRDCALAANKICRLENGPKVESVDINYGLKYSKVFRCDELKTDKISAPPEQDLSSDIKKDYLKTTLQASCRFSVDEATELASEENADRVFKYCTLGTVVSIKGCQLPCSAKKDSSSKDFDKHNKIKFKNSKR